MTFRETAEKERFNNDVMYIGFSDAIHDGIHIAQEIGVDVSYMNYVLKEYYGDYDWHMYNDYWTGYMFGMLRFLADASNHKDIKKLTNRFMSEKMAELKFQLARETQWAWMLEFGKTLNSFGEYSIENKLIQVYFYATGNVLKIN